MKVPKVIHQIWIGDKPIPTKWTHTWEKFCNAYDFEYKLWNDADISDLIFKHPCYEIYAQSKHYSMKSDIARYVILSTYGGIYIDADIIFLGQHESRFFGWENLVLVPEPDAQQKNLLSNAIIGCAKGDSFMSFVSNNIIDTYTRRIQVFGSTIDNCWEVTGPLFLTQCFSLFCPEVSILNQREFYPTDWETDNSQKNIQILAAEYPNATTFHFGYETCRLGNRYPVNHFTM